MQELVAEARSLKEAVEAAETEEERQRLNQVVIVITITIIITIVVHYNILY